MKSLTLLKQKEFSGFFWTMFYGAFNDNFFKNALVILITFKASETLNIPASILVTLSAGIFILPFFLFSATAGQISDYYEKSDLIKKIKISEILIMLLAVYGFMTEQIFFLLFVLFLMGFQSTIFGPVKYSIIPQLVNPEHLMSANAVVETGTFIAILLGTLLGGLAIAHPDYGAYLASSGVIIFAVLGWLSSTFIGKIPVLVDKLKVNWNILSQTIAILKKTAQNEHVFYSVVGISWFWFLGASFLSLFPSYSKEYLMGNEYVVNLLLTCFSIGIGIGSLLCEKLSKGIVSFNLVPNAILGMTITSFCLGFFSPPKRYAIELLSVSAFLSDNYNLFILSCLIGFAMFGGLYIVPLYSLVQKWAEPKSLSRVIAGNNILNAFFMVISSLSIISMIKMTITIPNIYVILSGCNLIIGFLLVRKLKNV